MIFIHIISVFCVLLQCSMIRLYCMCLQASTRAIFKEKSQQRSLPGRAGGRITQLGSEDTVIRGGRVGVRVSRGHMAASTIKDVHCVISCFDKDLSVLIRD